jgi:hypothetical protein
MVCEAEGYISIHAEYPGTPLLQSCSVPSCSTVELAYPSIPTHVAEYPFAVTLQSTVGTVQVPDAAVTEPVCGFERSVSAA